MNVLVLGNFHSGPFPSAVVLLAASAWLVGGASRYAMVLAGKAGPRAERATAIGVFVGLALAVAMLGAE